MRRDEDKCVEWKRTSTIWRVIPKGKTSRDHERDDSKIRYDERHDSSLLWLITLVWEWRWGRERVVVWACEWVCGWGRWGWRSKRETWRYWENERGEGNARGERSVGGLTKRRVGKQRKRRRERDMERMIGKHCILSQHRERESRASSART